MRTPPSHMNCGSHHEFNQQDLKLCESGKYAFMVLQKYSIITRTIANATKIRV